jgi:hypothetical protein
MAKMNFKDFKGKEFLVEKGERVGLGVALFLMIVLIITSLFIPPNGFFSGSPSDKADSLKNDTTGVENKLRSNKPGPNDQPGDPRDKLIALETQPISLDPYRVTSFFEAQQAGSSSRRPPELYTIDGGAATSVALNVKTYNLIDNGEGQYTKIILLESGGGGGKSGFPMMPGMRGGIPMMGSPGPGSPGPGSPGPGSPGPMGGRGPGAMRPGMLGRSADVQAAEDAERKRYKEMIVNIDEADKAQGYEPAVQPRPLHMAIIAASFPYKKQLDEFKNKLHLNSITDVLNETVKTKDGEIDAFRFTGVNVQRRELDPAGNALTGWQTIDPARAYIPWMVLSGQEIEDEDPDILPIKFPGLVMDRLREFRPDDLSPRANQSYRPGMVPGPGGLPGPGGAPRGGDLVRSSKTSYPDKKLYNHIPNLKKTLNELKQEGAATKQIAAPRSRFAPKTVDPWRPAQQNTEDSKTPTKEEAPKEDATVPEHCLVRVIDITIEPGKTYQYRLQVRMANPNYQRKDVASQSYAQDEELPVDDKKWFEVPQKVTVDPEMIHYAVDQTDVDRSFRGVDWNKPVHADREVALQIHRRIEATYLGKQKYPTFIGDWAIADRVIVARGEQIGRRVKVELPVWKYDYKDYTIAADPHDRSRKPGIEVNFGYERPDGAEALLVDFEGGKGQRYSPTPAAKTEDGAAPPPSRGVSDDSGIEVLILTPEGKLIARNGANDREEDKRKERRDELHKRIDDVKKKAGGKSSDGKPF